MYVIALQRRANDSFLEILQEGGARGEVFTLSEVSELCIVILIR